MTWESDWTSVIKRELFIIEVMEKAPMIQSKYLYGFSPSVLSCVLSIMLVTKNFGPHPRAPKA